MPRHILYAYADGSDLQQIESLIEQQLSEFVTSRHWISGSAWVVNQREEKESQSIDLPSWDLGLNLELPDPGSEPEGWFSDVEEVAVFLRTLSEASGREFVIGISDTTTGISEDLFTVTSGPLDIEQLRSIIGVGPPPK